jgi:hypothetical protein
MPLTFDLAAVSIGYEFCQQFRFRSISPGQIQESRIFFSRSRPWTLFSVTDSDIVAKLYRRWRWLDINCLGRGAYASREIEWHWLKEFMSEQSRRKHNSQNTGKTVRKFWAACGDVINGKISCQVLPSVEWTAIKIESSSDCRDWENWIIKLQANEEMPRKQIPEMRVIIMRRISFLLKRQIREIETEFLDPKTPVVF